jgi:hypothetical protein
MRTVKTRTVKPKRKIILTQKDHTTNTTQSNKKNKLKYLTMTTYSALSILARRTALVASQRAASHCTIFVKGLSTKVSKPPMKEKVPPADYYNGHLMTDHLEYIDDLIEKTMEMEGSMGDLKETYTRKREIYYGDEHNGVRWMESSEIDALFQDAATQKAKLSEQLADMKKLLADAKKTFAVDAPDGYPDDLEKEELKEIDFIIEEAAAHEDGGKIDYQRKMQAKADVDAKKTFAVDAPDGNPDAFEKEELVLIDRIIVEAAANEDAEKIKYKHRMEDAIRKDRIRDPEHDW